MTIRHLKTFVIVCNYNSISKAAEQLCVAQPSVSQTIKELENYYNIILFNRINKRLVLTKEGEGLLIKAKEVLESFKEFEDLANKEVNNPIINIGVSITFGTLFLPRFDDEIEKEVINIDPHYYVGLTKQIEEKILSGELDFAITEDLPKDKTIKSINFGKDSLVIVSDLDYDIPNKIKITDINNYPLLLRDSTSVTRKLLEEVLTSKGIKLNTPKMESISNASIISMLLNKEGIAILPYYIVLPYIESKKLKVIETDVALDRKVYIVSHKNKKFKTTAKKVYNLCLKLLKT